MKLAKPKLPPIKRFYPLMALAGMAFLSCPVLAGDGEEQKQETDTVVVDPGEDRVWKGEPISLSLKDADLVEVLRSLAKLAGTNIIIDSRVKGKVTLELKDVPWDQALHVILKTHGLAVDTGGRDLWAVAAGGKPSIQQSTPDD